jgi:hypothetical protein
LFLVFGFESSQALKKIKIENNVHRLMGKKKLGRILNLKK